MIGTLVKFFVGIGAVINIITGAVFIIIGIPLGNGTVESGTYVIIIGFIIVVWGLFILAGLSKLKEVKH